MNVVIDYNVGNLDSVVNGFKRAGIEVIISKNPQDIIQANTLILPGVGAFEASMTSLKNSGLIPYIMEHIQKGKLLLGICLGMQLLYETSYEYGTHKGLGILKGSIKKITGKVKIPHMGWNNLAFQKKDPILKYINEGDYVYFVHSYYVDSSYDEVLADTKYGVKIPAIVKKENVYATQFHPEKSGAVGLKILQAYGEIINDTITSN